MRLADHPALSKGLALGILLGLFCVIYFGIIDPLLERYRLDQREISDLRAALARTESVASERTSRQTKLAALESERSSHEGFLVGTNDTLVAVDIQNRIKSAVATAHGKLASAQVLTSEVEGKLRRISVREQLSLPMSGLAVVFYQVESSAPFLFIDNLDIRPVLEARRLPTDPVNSSVVEVRFDAYGYMREKS